MAQPRLNSQQTSEISRIIRQELRFIKSSSDDKEELFSEAWVRVLRYYDRFDPSRAKLVTFISIHTRGAALDYFRANYNPRRHNTPEHKAAFNNMVALGIDHREQSYAKSLTNDLALSHLIDTLPERDRDLMLMYLDGNNLKEMADKVGVSESRISQRITSIVKGLTAYASE